MKKFLATILSFFLLSSLSFAKVQENQPYVISDFSKLLDNATNPYLIPKDGALQARNVRASKQFGGLSKRDEMLLYGSIGSYSVTGLHRYYKSDGTKYLLATGATYLELGNDDTGVFTTLRDQLSDGSRWQFATYKDTAIGCNGVNYCQKYDGKTTTTDNTSGARTANLLTADLGAPFAELNTGSNLTASRWYQYKIVYYDGVTYQYSNARSNPILTGSSVKDLKLTDIPPGPFGTTSRIIYRTTGQTSRAAVEATTTFYKVASISDNTTTTYSDAISDATISGDAAPTWATVSAGTNITPPIAKYILIHGDRLWLANAPSLHSDIYWSEAFLPNYFDTGTSYDQIRPDDGDEITFIKSMLGYVIIGKTNTIQKYITDNPDTTLWTSTPPYSYIGCPAPYSAKNSPLGIIYLGRDGIYIFNGNSSKLISDAVSPTIKDILATSMALASSVYFNNEYQVAYTSDSAGRGTNDSVLLFDIVRDAYEIDDKNINVFEVLNSGTDFGTVYSGSSLNDGNIFVHSNTPTLLTYRYKSKLELGTTDTAVIYGDENAPYINIGWNVTLDSSTFAGVTLDSALYSTATIDRPTTTGYWYSNAAQVNALSYDKLYWNAVLGSTGSITFAIRSASTSGGIESATWSSEFSNPSGSSLTSLTANDYVQLRATLHTTDITQSPYLYALDDYVIKMSYKKEGGRGEGNFNTVWESGYSDFGVPLFPKRIKAISFYYTGTSGTINFNLKNDMGDIDQSFTFDLSQDPTASSTDDYTGDAINKIYTWYAPTNSSSVPSPIGRYWKFKITENENINWTISRIEIKYDTDEQYF